MVMDLKAMARVMGTAAVKGKGPARARVQRLVERRESVEIILPKTNSVYL
jgi:hypothetical protein